MERKDEDDVFYLKKNSRLEDLFILPCPCFLQFLLTFVHCNHEMSQLQQKQPPVAKQQPTSRPPSANEPARNPPKTQSHPPQQIEEKDSNPKQPIRIKRKPRRDWSDPNCFQDGTCRKVGCKWTHTKQGSPLPSFSHLLPPPPSSPPHTQTNQTNKHNKNRKRGSPIRIRIPQRSNDHRHAKRIGFQNEINQ